MPTINILRRDSNYVPCRFCRAQCRLATHARSKQLDGELKTVYKTKSSFNGIITVYFGIKCDTA